MSLSEGLPKGVCDEGARCIYMRARVPYMYICQTPDATLWPPEGRKRGQVFCNRQQVSVTDVRAANVDG